MEELAKLQDDVPAEPFEKVKPTIEHDIGDIDKKGTDQRHYQKSLWRRAMAGDQGLHIGHCGGRCP